MAICGLSLHLSTTESRKNLEQKFIFQIGTLTPHGINERFSFNKCIPVFQVAMFPPIAYLLLYYKNCTQPIIPRLALTKGSKRQLLESLYGGQFTFSTPLIKPNFCVLLPHRRSTSVSLETTPFIHISFLDK